MKKLKELLQASGIAAEENCLLAEHSTFRIGGRASLACFPKSREQMLTVLQAINRQKIPFLVIGNASNVVFDDRGFDGAVVFTGGWKELIRKDNTIFASAGAPLHMLAKEALSASLSGLEFAYGIPGTVGGAVLMNAGAFGGCIAEVCVRSEYFDFETGELGFFEGDRQAFANRTSIYEKQARYTVLGAEFCLQPGEPAEIRERMEDFLTRRRQTQPLEFPSAGSVFKRPEGYFAGKLIEDCGLKGTRVGGAEVSQKHAGFIVNRGGATAADVKELVELIRSRVLDCTGVTLECEIRFL